MVVLPNEVLRFLPTDLSRFYPPHNFLELSTHVNRNNVDIEADGCSLQQLATLDGTAQL